MKTQGSVYTAKETSKDRPHNGTEVVHMYPLGKLFSSNSSDLIARRPSPNSWILSCVQVVAIIGHSRRLRMNESSSMCSEVLWP